MKTIPGSCARRIVSALCIYLVAILWVNVAYAQAIPQDPTRVDLAKLVHLNMGITSVDKVMSTLSEQSGLTIKAADYLRERTLTVRMDDISATFALNALAALNDWSWSVTLPGQILVTRRRLRLDAVAAAIPRAMQAAIPSDIRRYLHIPTPTEDMSKYVNALDGWVSLDANVVNDKTMRTIIGDQTDLIASLAPGILNGVPIPYAKLTPIQRSELLVALVFPTLRDSGFQLLHGDVLPHVADINNAFLQMSGQSTLLILSIMKDGNSVTGSGFGAPIH